MATIILIFKNGTQHTMQSKYLPCRQEYIRFKGNLYVVEEVTTDFDNDVIEINLCEING